jgi:hypothetical protein
VAAHPIAPGTSVRRPGALDNGNSAPWLDATAATTTTSALLRHCAQPPRPTAKTADEFHHNLAALELLAAAAQLPHPVTVITRLRLDAALYEKAPPREKGTRGAPRKKGARLPTLAEILCDSETAWALISVRWYGGASRQMRVSSATAVWYHSGLPPVPIRWVLISDPLGQFEPQALLNLSLVGGLGFGQRVAILEDIRQTFDGGLPPFAPDIWVNAILR